MMESSAERRSSIATTMVRDELLAVLPHLRRLPERIDRILTLTGQRRAARPQRRRRGRPAHPAHARQPRLLLVAIGAAFLVVVGAAAGRDRRRARWSPSGTGLFEVFGYGGLLAGAVLLLRVVAAVARDGTT